MEQYSYQGNWRQFVRFDATHYFRESVVASGHGKSIVDEVPA
jgi:hypothetical protein